MKRTICLLVVFLCWGSIAISQDVKKKVAVYVTGDVESGYKKVIGSKMVSGITKSENYIAVERTTDFLSALSKEQDYQTSGAVNDNQIVRLGQQFGVRFVVVVDVSEIFESIFISARMIDVQTGQIIGAAETNKTVDNLEGLMNLSENVVTVLLENITFQNYNIEFKVKGPFSTLRDISNNYGGSGETEYHIASQEEIEILKKYLKHKQKEMFFPIYFNIQPGHVFKSKDMYIDKNGKTHPSEYTYNVFAQLLKENGTVENISGTVTEGRINQSVPSGYVYFIKNSDSSNE